MTPTQDAGEKLTGRVFAGRWFIVGALVLVGLGFLAITTSGIGQNLVYYWGPTELRTAGVNAYGATIRLGGLVAASSVQHRQDASLLEFDVTDGKSLVHVRSTSVPPQMFREGIGVVVEGTMTKDGSFVSDRLLVKHGNDYQPPAPGSHADTAALIESTRGLTPAAKP